MRGEQDDDDDDDDDETVVLKDDDDDEEEEEEDDLDLPLLSFENIARNLPAGTEAEVKRLRRIVTYMDMAVDNQKEVVEELQNLREEFDAHRNHRVDLLVARNQAKDAKIRRLENLLVSITGNHPFSQSLLEDVFEHLGLQEDAELKERLLRRRMVARPQNVVDLLPASPDVGNVDDSVVGVRQRGVVRTGLGVPNSA